MKRVFTILAMLVAFVAAAVPARANSISFDLGLPNAGIAGLAGPYANVIINLLDATHAQVTFQSYDGYVMGNGSSAALNVNGNVTVLGGEAGIIGTNSGIGFTPGPYTLPGPRKRRRLRQFQLQASQL